MQTGALPALSHLPAAPPPSRPVSDPGKAGLPTRGLLPACTRHPEVGDGAVELASTPPAPRR